MILTFLNSLLSLRFSTSRYFDKLENYIHLIPINFTPHGATLWNNRPITINRKILFKQEWNEKKVVYVVNLIDEAGRFIQYNSFMEKFVIKCSLRECNSLCRKIPLSLEQLIQNTLNILKCFC